jgi:probable FeS assembly SUF system protein SufT
VSVLKTKKVVLKRDCDALVIPTAIPITIPSGTTVEITQALGGAITVLAGGNLTRIEAKDADALGLNPEEFIASSKNHGQIKDKSVDGPVNLEEVWIELRQCYDPEIPVNIVELGLVYACTVEASQDNKSNHVKIDMTLTAPGCAMGPVIINDVETRVLSVKNVTGVTVNIVFEPVWDQSMMSDVAKLELGML